MTTRRVPLLEGLLGLALLSCSERTDTVPDRQGGGPAPLAAGDLGRSGTVSMAVTCRPEVEDDFETAVALLHSFFYDEARRRFADIAGRDPGCAMAWWGIAMTWYHPLWQPPTAGERAKGLKAVGRARAIGGATDLERGLIEAIAAYFTTGEVPAPGAESGVVAGGSCCGPHAHGAPARAFHARLEELHSRFPDDVEVTAFYALAMLGTSAPGDETYARRHAAAALLEPLFETHPDHPGIAHYIIHAYDCPALADRALRAARRYDDIAPWVPSALHMPTHVYTRLGMWKDSIEGNIAASVAARDHAARHHGGRTTMHDLHAKDFLVYAYLQTAQDGKARDLLDELLEIEHIVPGNGLASAYAAAAIPARFVLERRDWEAAVELELPVAGFVGEYPMAVAHVEFARAVGAARTGNAAAAMQAVSRLTELRDELEGSRFDRWSDQVEIQRLAAAAWLAQAGGEAGEAERLLRGAVEIEEGAGTHPVVPGPLLPAREQLGDLLLENGRPADALVEYERSLQAFPRRFWSHVGAGRAAAGAGNREASRRHYESLLVLAARATGRRSTVDAAREAVRGE